MNRTMLRSKSSAVGTISTDRKNKDMQMDIAVSFKQGPSGLQTAVYECIVDNNVGLLKNLVASDEVRKCFKDLDEGGSTPLHHAARLLRSNAVRIIVEQGSFDVEKVDSKGSNVLHCLCSRRPASLRETADTIALVKYLLQYCPLLANACDRLKNAPLHCASRVGDKGVMAALLVHPGIQINAGNTMGHTPLHRAVSSGSVEVIRPLIQTRGDPSITDISGNTVLHLAVTMGDLSMVRLLCNTFNKLSNSKQVLNARNQRYETCLDIAIGHRDVEMSKLLIDSGAHPNLHAEGATCLHLACSEGAGDIVTLLVDRHKWDPSQRNRYHRTVLHCAVSSQSPNIVNIILKKMSSDDIINIQDGHKMTALMLAVKMDSEEIVHLLLDHGASVSIPGPDERTCLHLAVQSNKLEIVQILLEWSSSRTGGDIHNLSDRDGATAMHTATSNGFVEIFKLLGRHGANMNVRNASDETLLHLAAKNGQLRIVELLLSTHSPKQIHDVDQNGLTSLHAGARAGQIDVVHCLISHGANVNSTNHSLQTPLGLAAMNGHLEVVKELLNHRADIHCIDINKMTPLHLSAQNGHADVIEELLQRAADCSALDDKGRNPLEAAVLVGQQKAAETIVRSQQWMVAFRKPERVSPMHQLIAKMPEVASIALHRCVSKESFDDSLPAFNYELIESMNDVGEGSGSLLSGQTDQHTIQNFKKNHPLQLIVTHKQVALSTHPVVLSLLHHKWKLANAFYISFMVFFALYSALFSAFMVESEAPFQYNETTCANQESIYPKSRYPVVAKYAIWVMAIIGACIEVFQIVVLRWTYLKKVVNLLDWFSYVGPSIACIPLTSCGMHTPWQWQLGAVAVFVCWMDLLLFFRRLPTLGIYVVMIVEIIKTFMRFFVIFFVFSLGFALTFNILIGNQPVFRSPGHALIKAWILMSGEMEYSTIFLREDGSGLPHQDQVYFDQLSYVLFALSVIFVSILVGNLLTALAVKDVNELQKNACFEKFALQVDLALDVEAVLPSAFQKRIMKNRTTSRSGILGRVIDSAMEYI